jgi:hypothetical protein
VANLAFSCFFFLFCHRVSLSSRKGYVTEDLAKCRRLEEFTVGRTKVKGSLKGLTPVRPPPLNLILRQTQIPSPFYAGPFGRKKERKGK